MSGRRGSEETTKDGLDDTSVYTSPWMNWFGKGGGVDWSYNSLSGMLCPPSPPPDDLYQRTSIVVCHLMSVEVCDNVCSLCDNVCSCQSLVSWKELQPQTQTEITLTSCWSSAKLTTCLCLQRLSSSLLLYLPVVVAHVPSKGNDEAFSSVVLRSPSLLASHTPLLVLDCLLFQRSKIVF